MSAKLPDFLGIGAEKAASTWLYMCLYEHPDICMAERKELRFFDSDRNYARGLDNYARWFAHCPPEACKGEFSPTYLASKSAPERIKRDCGDIQFIVTLRDPIERVKSHVQHWIRQGRIQTTYLAKALEDEPILIEKSRYYGHLREYMKHYDREKFMVIVQEEISGREMEILEALWRFLGVRNGYIPDHAHQAVSKGYVPRYQGLERLKYGGHRMLRRTPKGNRMVNALRQSGLSQLYRRVNSRSASLQYSTQDIRRLRETFSQEYEALPHLIGQDLSIWAHADLD